MGEYAPLTNQEVKTVAAAVIPETSGALWRLLPRVIVGDKRSQYKNTTYPISPMSTFAADGNGEGKSWEPGQSTPVGKEIEEATVTLRTRGASSDVITDYLDRAQPNRIGSYTAKGRGLNSQLERVLDVRAVNALQDTGNFGAKVDVTGGAGSPLDQYPAAATPFQTIESQIQPLRTLRAQGGDTSLEAFIREYDLLTYAGYEEYNHMIDSANATGRRPKRIDTDEIKEIFRRKHKLDAVHIVEASYNQSYAGRAENIVDAMSDLVIVLLDRSRDEWNLVNGDEEGPQGGFVMSMSQMPTARTSVNADKDTEHFHVWATSGFTNPYNTAYPASRKLGVIFNNQS